MAKVTVEAGDIEYGNGVCTKCGHIQDGCEPDARKYECEECGEAAVYGLEEAILMGLVELGDGAEDELMNLM
tara:strand:- start:11804 stop:12019 length:216 start_codon:yes stop_codon:yes gene_type:complete